MSDFRLCRIGGDEYYRLETGEFLMLFGRGPRFRQQSSVAERASALLDELESVRALRWGHQVHGAIIASLSEDEARPFQGAAGVGNCDGLMTDEVGLALMVQTADCLPVLFFGGQTVAAVHAGWRGIARGIHTRALRRFSIEYGVPSEKISVVIGPGIGRCHYEVGPEVIEALKRRGVEEVSWREGIRVDLRDLVEKELVGQGVSPGRVSRIGSCTYCDTSLASWRRDGEDAGRQISLVVIT